MLNMPKNANKSFQTFENNHSMYFSKIESKNSFYKPNERRSHYSTNKLISQPRKFNQQATVKNLRIISPNVEQKKPYYDSKSFNFFRIKGPLNDRSFKNISSYMDYPKTTEQPDYYSKLKSAQTKKKNNQMTLKVDFHRTLIDDKNDSKRNNHIIIESKYQAKTTKVPKSIILQKEKSENTLRKRLINSVDPTKRNINNSYFITRNNNHNLNQSFKENIQNNPIKTYNNIGYFDSKHLKNKNGSDTIKNSKNNNTKTITIISRNNIDNKKSKKTENNKWQDEKKYFYRKINNTGKGKEKEKGKEKGKEKEVKEEINKQVLLKLRNLFSSLSALPNKENPFDIFEHSSEPILLCPEIFLCYHSQLKQSTCSSENEFKKTDFIKGYAYSTSRGNIRDYNEDTITARKIIDPKDKNNYFYIFAVYDGHGGNGCSIYLKNNLYKNITECSMIGLRNAINLTEQNFLEYEGENQYGELDDTSGSCASIVLLKNKKCIIANVGDSRCVLFKNKRLFFATKDHKPNSHTEKRRIESAGGSVFQSSAIIPLYQNGKMIEMPWRVNPGRLSVSRTFGDIEIKLEKFGGKKNVVVCTPDIVEFELNDQYNFLVIACDGVFDVLSNMEILECIKIVLKINKNKKRKINELCGDCASMIMKSSLAKGSFDNVSCIVVAFNLNDII
jgi:serine/threonine protein phosphatase PrpC